MIYKSSNMLKKVLFNAKLLQNQLVYRNCRLCNTLSVVGNNDHSKKIDIKDTRNVRRRNDVYVDFKKKSGLEPCDGDLSHVAPYLRPSFNFAAYVNKSETLQELVKLGVDLHKLEKNVEVPPFLLRLNFEKDIKEHIIFLHDLGLRTDEIGELITQNAFILKETLDDLEVRINYLKSKKFDDEMITRIVQKNPHWLSHSTKKIDENLGYFQKEFGLKGDQVRYLAVKKPKLITYDRNKIKVNLFVLREEMGFSEQELSQMVLDKPKLLVTEQSKLLKAFEYIHKQMEIPTEIIAKFPGVLTCREFRLKQRHLFLKALNRDQYDPLKPNYISLLSIVSGTDAIFATEVAKSSAQAFNAFLKTL